MMTDEVPTGPSAETLDPVIKQEDGAAIHYSHAPAKRAVCDHCRRRRIRCDGRTPCQQCVNAALTCKREHVPKKRGPKRGHGRVINELRARENQKSRDPDSRSGSDIETEDFSSAPTSAAPSAPPSPSPWSAVTSDPRNAPEPKSVFSTEQLRPNNREYLHLVPRLVDLYYEHIYPIMPLLYMPEIRRTIARPLAFEEKNLVYALAALTSFHMSGKSLNAPGPASWDSIGRFFLDECISVRQSYDFVEDVSLSAVISSFWLSTSFFEINQSRKSWYYLREALTLALDLRLQDDSSYIGLEPAEDLCRRRTFWQLFVTERSFAVLRNKPITFRRTPSLPTKRHAYESPDIHAGFLKLISSYIPLDESFVNAWNDGGDPRITALTYLNLQQTLAQPLDFLRPKRTSSSNSLQGIASGASQLTTDEDDEDDPKPTSIQKADLLITQQWLRLIVWQSSFRQGLLSTAAGHDSMAFSYPLSIAHDTAAILQSLPSKAVEVHGMGIFEKIFEIGTWCVNVLGAYDSGSRGSPIARAMGLHSPVPGMDFVGGAAGGGDLAVLGRSRMGTTIDPLEFFVRVLSASPNSRTMFADKLLMFAGETSGGTRMSLSPGLSMSTTSPNSIGDQPWTSSGNMVGEVVAEPEEIKTDVDQAAMADPMAFNSGAAFDHSTGFGAGLGIVPPTTPGSASLASDETLMADVARDWATNNYGFGSGMQDRFSDLGPPTSGSGNSGHGNENGMNFLQPGGMVLGDDNEMDHDGTNIPRSQPGTYQDGLMGVW